MADEDDRVTRGNAMWQRFLDLVPPEVLAAPPPPPQPVPVPKPEPVPQAVVDDEKEARRIQLEIVQDRRKADQAIRDYERDARQDILDILQAMHEKQKGSLKL